MDKNKLVGFINKYHLGGEIKSTKIESNGKSLSTRFISGDKSVVGSVKMPVLPAVNVTVSTFDQSVDASNTPMTGVMVILSLPAPPSIVSTPPETWKSTALAMFIISFLTK